MILSKNNTKPLEETVSLEEEDQPLLSPTPTSNKPNQLQLLWGLSLCVISAVLLSVTTIFVKLGAPTLPVSELVLARGGGQLLFSLLMCWWKGIYPLGDPSVRFWMYVRGAAGAASLGFFYYAITIMPLADATVLRFTGPIFSAILAHFFLGEDYGIFDGLASIVTLLGVVLVSQPEFLFGDDTEAGTGVGQVHHVYQRSLGSMCCLLSAMIGAWAIVSIRQVGKRCHFLVFVFYFGVAGTLLGLAGMAFQGLWVAPRTSLEWISVLVIAVLSFAGQALLNAGVQLAPAGPATLMRNVDVLCAYLYGVALFNEIPNSLSLLGAVLVLCCLISLAFVRYRSSRLSSR